MIASPGLLAQVGTSSMIFATLLTHNIVVVAFALIAIRLWHNIYFSPLIAFAVAVAASFLWGKVPPFNLTWWIAIYFPLTDPVGFFAVPERVMVAWFVNGWILPLVFSYTTAWLFLRERGKSVSLDVHWQFGLATIIVVITGVSVFLASYRWLMSYMVG